MVYSSLDPVVTAFRVKFPGPENKTGISTHPPPATLGNCPKRMIPALVCHTTGGTCLEVNRGPTSSWTGTVFQVHPEHQPSLILNWHSWLAQSFWYGKKEKSSLLGISPAFLTWTWFYIHSFNSVYLLVFQRLVYGVYHRQSTDLSTLSINLCNPTTPCQSCGFCHTHTHTSFLPFMCLYFFTCLCLLCDHVECPYLCLCHPNLHFWLLTVRNSDQRLWLPGTWTSVASLETVDEDATCCSYFLTGAYPSGSLRIK